MSRDDMTQAEIGGALDELERLLIAEDQKSPRNYASVASDLQRRQALTGLVWLRAALEGLVEDDSADAIRARYRAQGDHNLAILAESRKEPKT